MKKRFLWAIPIYACVLLIPNCTLTFIANIEYKADLFTLQDWRFANTIYLRERADPRAALCLEPS